MNIYSNFKSRQLFIRTLKIVLLGIFGLCFANSVYSATTLVNCTGNATDRGLIQSAIDHARSGDMIKLANICQLDGTEIYVTKSNLTIEGAGQSGGWSTVVKGITQSNSTLAPLGDNGSPSYTYFNRGFRIGAIDGSVSVANVKITGIKFQSLNRAINVIPQLGANSSLCSDITVSNNSVSNLTIENNWFDYNNRGISAYGNNDHMSAQNNLFTHSTGDIDFLLDGQNIPCLLSDGSRNPIPIHIGTPAYAVIMGNSNQNDQQPLFSRTLSLFGVSNVKVMNNILSNVSGGLVVELAGKNNLIFNNSFDAGGINLAENQFPATGIVAFTIAGGLSPQVIIPSANNLVMNNEIKNALPGIQVDSATTGYTFINNKITGTIPGIPEFGVPNLGDVLFCDDGTGNTGGFCAYAPGQPTFSNKLISPNCLNVVDLGVNNKLLGFISVSTNTNVPPSGQCMLLK